MSYDLCVFDLDGTLTDPKLGITRAYQHALTTFGLNVELDSLAGYIGPPLREVFSGVFGFSDSDIELAVAKFREYYAEIGLLENSVYPDIPELLQKLVESGKTLAVATNKVKPYTLEILKHFELEKYFAFVSGDKMDGSLTRNGKREIIQIVMDALNPGREMQTIMIGDRKHDILGALELGIYSIGVTWGYGARTELEEAGAKWIVDSPAELRLLLNE